MSSAKEQRLSYIEALRKVKRISRDKAKRLVSDKAITKADDKSYREHSE